MSQALSPSFQAELVALRNLIRKHLGAGYSLDDLAKGVNRAMGGFATITAGDIQAFLDGKKVFPSSVLDDMRMYLQDIEGRPKGGRVDIVANEHFRVFTPAETEVIRQRLWDYATRGQIEPLGAPVITRRVFGFRDDDTTVWIPLRTFSRFMRRKQTKPYPMKAYIGAVAAYLDKVDADQVASKATVISTIRSGLASIFDVPNIAGSSGYGHMKPGVYIAQIVPSTIKLFVLTGNYEVLGCDIYDGLVFSGAALSVGIQQIYTMAQALGSPVHMTYIAKAQLSTRYLNFTTTEFDTGEQRSGLALLRRVSSYEQDDTTMTWRDYNGKILDSQTIDRCEFHLRRMQGEN